MRRRQGLLGIFLRSKGMGYDAPLKLGETSYLAKCFQIMIMLCGNDDSYCYHDFIQNLNAAGCVCFGCIGNDCSATLIPRNAFLPVESNSISNSITLD